MPLRLTNRGIVRGSPAVLHVTMRHLFLMLVLAVGVIHAKYTPQEVRCWVCKRVVQEMEKEINKVSPNKKLNLGHRINDKGKVADKSKPFARSETHLSELMDTVCEQMQEYVKAVHKPTGKLEVIPLMSETGTMNPNIDDYELIQDSDLNRSLTFYCEGIVEEFENEIYRVLAEEREAPDIKLCTEEIHLCDLPPEGGRSEL